MIILLVFLFGIAIGSFLNVVIDRLPHEKSIIKGRSWCDSCKKTLAWYDLIPVLSFILLGGKCRYCHAPLSYQYPAIELLTGALFIATFIFVIQQDSMQYQVLSIMYGFDMIYYLFIVSMLISIFFIDIKYGIIPDKIVFLSIVISFLYFILNHTSLILNHTASALGALLFFLIIFLATKGRGMGFGDVKFAFLMGLILGFPKIVAALYIAFLTGAIISIILILMKLKKLRGDTIPFGPFLVFGTFMGLYLGEKITQILFSYL